MVSQLYIFSDPKHWDPFHSNDLNTKETFTSAVITCKPLNSCFSIQLEEKKVWTAFLSIFEGHLSTSFFNGKQDISCYQDLILLWFRNFLIDEGMGMYLFFSVGTLKSFEIELLWGHFEEIVSRGSPSKISSLKDPQILDTKTLQNFLKSSLNLRIFKGILRIKLKKKIYLKTKVSEWSWKLKNFY